MPTMCDDNRSKRLNGVASAGTVARIVGVNIAVGSGAAFIIIVVDGRHVVRQLMKVKRFHQWSFMAHVNPKGEKECQKHSTTIEKEGEGHRTNRKVSSGFWPLQLSPPEKKADGGRPRLAGV
ncbi:unnamed protein product [Cuscuta campestris]|uniref:Uncharacterized protein n=1 Tax=Cuscuta campestris TaxID=132261 RepID=A0A484N2Q2_9ASTE|nr:unnamed protein product [Cuscuta campestris]